MESFIYENKCLSNSLCDKIIEMFNSDNTQQSKQFNNRLCIDFTIPEHDIWFEIKNTIINELEINLQSFFSLLNKNNIVNQNNKSIYKFYIEKSIKNKPLIKFEKHNNIDYYKKKRKLLRFYFCLNDIEDGGEIIFFNNREIKSEKGKFILFPIEWFFPYFVNTPLCYDKYTIFGDIYIDI